MNVRILRALDEVVASGPAWEELRRRASSDNPFLTAAWTRAWIETDPAVEPYVLMLSHGDALAAVLPLVRSCGSLRKLRFVEGDMYGLLADGDVDAAADAVATALAAHSADWDVIEMSELHDEAPDTVALRDAFLRHGLGWEAHETSQSPFVSWETDRAAYEARVGKKVVNEVKRRQRQLEAIGPVRFERVIDARGIEEHFPRVVDLHKRRWQERIDTSAFANPKRLAGMTEAAHAMAAVGTFAMDLMFVDGQLVAYSYGFKIGKRYVYYSPGFDPAYAPFSVSKILLYKQITDGMARGEREFDFSRGAEPYKLVWATGTRRGLTVLVHHGALRSRAQWEAERLRLRTVVSLKSKPEVVHFKRVVLGQLRRRVEPRYVADEFGRVVSKVSRSVADRGAAGTAERALKRGVERVHRLVRGRLYACDLPTRKPTPREGTTFDVLRPSGFAELAAGGRYDLEEIVRKYYRGARCWAVRVDGALAVYGWELSACEVGVPELGGRFELSEHEMYITDCYTLPAFRGRGLYQFLLEAMLASAGERGLKRGYGTAEEDNVASIKGQEKAGFKLALKVDERRWWFESASKKAPLNVGLPG